MKEELDEWFRTPQSHGLLENCDSEEIRYPEESLVERLCENFIIQIFALNDMNDTDFKNWCSQVSSILSFCRLVSEFPIKFHILRFFHEMANLYGSFTQARDIFVHAERSNLSSDMVNPLDSMELYTSLRDETDMITSKGIQLIVCVYVHRCEVNSKSNVLSYFLNDDQNIRNCKSSVNIESLLDRVIRNALRNREFESDLLQFLDKGRKDILDKHFN